jgi:hypothetical protein
MNNLLEGQEKIFCVLFVGNMTLQPSDLNAAPLGASEYRPHLCRNDLKCCLQRGQQSAWCQTGDRFAARRRTRLKISRSTVAHMYY